MKRRFVAPVLIGEATLAEVALGRIIIGSQASG